MTHVSTALFKQHLNLDHDQDDALLAHKLGAAEGWIENFIGAPLAELDPFPADLVEAILQLAAYWYEQREAVSFGVNMNAVPFGVLDLVRPYREWGFA